MAKITVIGSFNIDMVIHMDAFPLPGQTVMANPPSYLPGGKGANQAVACARVGGDVEMIGKLGDDAYGRDFRRLMQDEGIDTSHVFTSSLPTGMALIQINAAGENQICVIPCANHDLDHADVQAIRPLLAKTEWVILQLELRPDVTFALIRLCHELGVRVVLNPAPAIPIAKESAARPKRKRGRKRRVNIERRKLASGPDRRINISASSVGRSIRTILASCPRHPGGEHRTERRRAASRCPISWTATEHAKERIRSY